MSAGLLMAAFATSGGHAAAPAAGATIDNQAEATFFDVLTGYNVRVRSNTVRVLVQPQEALLLEAPQSVMRPAGGTAVLAHRVTNTGNVPSRVTLAVANATGDDFDLQGLAIVVDVNANGQADPGEPTLAPGTELGPLAPGASLDVVVVGGLATTLLEGQAAQVGVTARTVAQRVVVQLDDRVTVGDGAQLQLVKAVSPGQAAAGQRLRFTLTASNNGNRASAGVPIRIDGAPATLTLVRDVIPPNTRFEAASTGGNAVTLFHLRGQPEFSFTTAAPVDLALIDAVAFGFRDPIQRGQSFSRSFDVRINDNASAAVVNTAQLVFNDGVRAGAVTVSSNSVSTRVPVLPPRLAYFADPTYSRTLRVMPVGNRVYVQADAAQCNLDAQRIETHRLTVRSTLTGDVETYMAEETQANSGVFRVQPYVQTTDSETTPAVPGDGLLSTRKDDRVVTTLEGCGATQVEAFLLIDPFGVVYDSRSNLPVAGAIVMLVDVTGAGNGGNAGGPARVLAADGTTPAPSRVTTGADGRFAFPLVAASDYRLVITAPNGYGFPSAQPAAMQPAGRVILEPASYGGRFRVDASTGAVELDVPLDAAIRSGLFIEKTAARNTVELGDFVDYTVRVRNVADELVGRIRVTDHLPAGFSYVRGSARLNGGRLRFEGLRFEEPDGGVGPVLAFEIGSIPDRGTATLTYRARVGPLALQGDGVNRVQASTPAPLPRVSNVAVASVQVLPGVFGDRGFVVGKVFVGDCAVEGDKRYAEHDGPGVPGVRLFLQDGTHVTTDRDGRYSLYGLASRTHVLKLDATTLLGLTPKVTDNRQARDAASRFVDIKSGQLLRADFALSGCSDALQREIAARTAVADRERDEGTKALDSRFDTTPQGQVDPRSLPAAGTIGVPLQGQIAGARPPNAAPKAASTKGTATGAVATTKTEGSVSDADIAAFDNQLAILSPGAGHALTQQQAPVVIKGRLGTHFVLTVNGTEVNEQRVGQRHSVEGKALQVWRFVGVAFMPGKNDLRVEQIDAFGIRRGEHAITVTAPGPLAELRLTPATARPGADGRTPLAITLETLDANGMTIGARTPVTLEATHGQWLPRDLDPDQPGVQIFVEGGRAALELLPPGEAVEARLRASSGSVASHATVKFGPDMRPLVAAGIVEGVLDLRRLHRHALQPVRARDGFEQELRGLSFDFDSGRASAGARASMFLKGRVKGDVLLTLAYDSDKAKKERLFRDIQPDAYYAVYGDSSVKGFDAQSTGRLYVRVDHDRFYALLGDYTTQTIVSGELGERRLGQYARSLNGVKGALRSDDGGRSEISGFASRSASRQVVQEMPALGVSGPYMLTRLPLIENSERVEIVTRDRDQPSRIVRTVVATRFADYQLEPLTGRLLFRAPVASIDADFNPNTIRVTYEVDQGGDAFWVGGVEGKHRVDDILTLSAGAVVDRNPVEPMTLSSVHAHFKVDTNTALAVEVATLARKGGAAPRATTDATGSGATALPSHGTAGRIEFKHESATLQAQAHVIRADQGFENPSAAAPKGQLDAAARVSLRVDPVTVVRAETLRSEALAGDQVRSGAQVTIDRQVGEYVRAELGLRRSLVSGTALDANPTVPPPEAGTSVRLKLLSQVPGNVPVVGQASVFAEAEQDVDDSSRRMVALGAETRVGGGLRLYGRHELISSLGNRWTLDANQQRNATIVGISGDAFADTQAFSEYRLRHAVAGNEAEAAMGLRRRWALGEGVGASAGIERIQVLEGRGGQESVAFTSAVDYSNDQDWRGNGRFELRTGARSDSLLNTLGAAWRLDAPWTLLARNAFALTRNSDGSGNAGDWLQLGMAYRDVEHHRWNSLLRTEYRGTKVTTAAGSASTRRDAFIVSTHANRQWRPGTVLAARLATRWAHDQTLGLDSRERTQMAAARITRDLNDTWDISLHGAVLTRGNVATRQYGLGVEMGYLLAKNLWLSGGWNLFGYRDVELSGQDYTKPGFYLRLRMKFDENGF